MINKMKCFLIFILILALSGCFSADSDGYVVSVDGEKISMEEYNVYFDEQIKSFEEQGGSDIWGVDFDGVSAVNVAKQNAVNTLVIVKAAVNHADQLGIELTDEDRAEAKEKAEKIKKDNSDMELLTKIMEETIIQSKVYDKITGSYQINDEEFEKYFSSYYEQNKEQYTKYIVKEIFIQNTDSQYSYEDIENKYNNIKNEADFENLAKEIYPDGSVEEQELDESLYSAEVLEKLASGKKGDFVFAEDNTGYHIFSIEDVKITPIDDVKEEVRQMYINDKKTEIYNTQNDSWTASMTVEKNNSVYDGITIEDN